MHTPSEKDRSWTGFRTSAAVEKSAESFAVDDVMVEQFTSSYKTTIRRALIFMRREWVCSTTEWYGYFGYFMSRNQKPKSATAELD